MNPSLKSFLQGLALGTTPVAVCAMLFYLAPLVIEGNAGTLLSFAVMGLFVMSSISVFITSFILIIRNKPIIGGVALVSQIVQIILAISFLA